MTTLPQTTPLRLPRPAAAQINLPSAGMATPYMVAPAAIANGTQLTGADIWRVIRSNLLLIGIVVIVSGVLGYFANSYLAKFHSRYTADGEIEVTPVGSFEAMQNGQVGGDTTSLTVEQATQVIYLRSANLIRQVIDDNAPGGVRDTAWFRSFAGDKQVENAKADLIDHLSITPEIGSRNIRVSFTANDGVSAKVIAEKVINAHVAEQQRRNEDRLITRKDELRNHDNGLNRDIDSLRSKLADLETKLGANGYEVATGHVSSTKDMELESLIQDSIKTRDAMGQAQDQYSTISAQINQDQDPAMVEQLINTDPEVARDRDMVSNLDMAINQGMRELGADHPSLIAMQKRQDVFQQKLALAISQARVKARSAVLEKLHDEVSRFQHELETNGHRQDQLRSDIQALSEDVHDYLQTKAELAEREAQKHATEEKESQLNDFLLAKHLNSVAVASLPLIPDKPSFPKIEIVMTTAILLGLMISLGIAFLREVLDTSIRSPRDITRVGSMNLLGMVPHEADDPQSSGARLPVVIFEAPHSIMAEQLRQVRTRLQHTASLDTVRSILITSPSPGDGKSTIACNLASGLALNGRRILLVDANFRRPELHRIFNLNNDQGFSDVLNNLDQFEHLVQETQVPNLYILPSGLKPTNATELLESQLLIDFIERAMEEFDHVIFDSGPLLFVSETVALAPRVDGVVTVARARANSRGVLGRMRDTLRQIKAEHIGIVLNAVRSHGGGYFGRNIRTYYEYQNNGRAA